MLSCSNAVANVKSMYYYYRCEQSLISTVNVRNCIKLYQTSEEHAAESLKTYCLQIISSHWVFIHTVCTLGF